MAFLVGCLCLFVASQAAAWEREDENRAQWATEENGVRIEATLEPGVARLSDELRLRLEARAPWRMTLSGPERPSSNRLGAFSILQWRASPPVRDGDAVVVRYEFRLEPLDVGELELPELAFLARDGDDSRRIALPAQRVSVTTSLKADEAGPDAFRPWSQPMEPPEPPPAGVQWWWVAGPVAVLLAAAWGLWRRRRGSPAPRQTPAEHALAALDRIRATGIVDANAKQSVRRVTDVLRTYLEQANGWRASGQTTEEFLEEARGRDAISDGERSELDGLMQQCDLVKFAKAEAREDEIREMIELTANVIRGVDLRIQERSAGSASRVSGKESVT